VRPKIIVFAKAPVPGKVKTRLARQFGAAAAADLHYALVSDTLEMLLPLASTADIVLSTDTQTDAWREYPVERSLQSPGNLGERMLVALSRALAAGHPQVLVLGSDSPGLQPAHVFSMLNCEADVALGPTDDGGFYAICCRRTTPEMFRGVAWSSSDTLASTVRAISAAGLRWELGTPWFDIDEPGDLERLRRSGAVPRHTARWIETAQGS
jgi:rSAM/selenodomain-associated transferase 1